MKTRDWILVIGEFAVDKMTLNDFTQEYYVKHFEILDGIFGDKAETIRQGIRDVYINSVSPPMRPNDHVAWANATIQVQ